MDEFTVPAEKSRLLERSRGRIEGLFEVRLAVLGAQGDWRPALQPPNASARIWVQLEGCTKAVSSAKVRGRAGRWGRGQRGLPAERPRRTGMAGAATWRKKGWGKAECPRRKQKRCCFGRWVCARCQGVSGRVDISVRNKAKQLSWQVQSSRAPRYEIAWPAAEGKHR